MKKLICFFIFLCTCLFAIHRAVAQSAYYDAKYIYDNCYDKDGGSFTHKENLFAVLKKYYPGINLSEAILNQDPFFKPYVPMAIAQSGENATFIETAAATVGGMDFTNPADAIAQFLLERGKDEVAIALVDQFKKFLQSYPESKIAFPATTGFIKNVESYNYAAMMPALKAAFQLDLNALSSNLIKLREIRTDASYLVAKGKVAENQTKQDTELIARVEEMSDFLNNAVAGRAVVGGLCITDGLAKGTNAVEVINNIALDRAFIDNTATIPKGDILANSVQFINLLSQSLKSSDEGRLWITKEEVSGLVQNDIMFNIYLGLLYAQSQNINHISFRISTTIDQNNVVGLEKILSDIKTAIDADVTAKAAFKQSFTNVADAASDAADQVISITSNKEQNGQTATLLIAGYASSISSFFKYGASLIPDNLKSTNLAAQAQVIESDVVTFTSVVDNLANTCYYIKSQNYAAAVLSTSTLFTEFAKNTSDAGRKADYQKFEKDYVRYGTLMAGILQAKNGVDIKAAIETVALPPGSYSIKQKSQFNISLNGYVGYGFDFNYAHGVYAPVGVSATLGSKKNGLPLTLFVSLIDVGSIVSYRLTDSSTDKLKQDVRLESIISLSAQAVFEVPNTPFAIAAGWRRTPKLFYSDETNFYVKSPRSVFNLSLLIDIPLFTIHNKPF